MGLELRFGLINLSTLVNGNSIKLMVMVHSTTPMEMFMRAIGKMIKQMERGNTHMITEQLMMENGKTTKEKVKEKSITYLGINMKVNGNKKYVKEKVACFLKENYMEEEYGKTVN